MNKKEIKNLHYNNKNEIQFEYGGQIHHHSMNSLKEVFANYWTSLNNWNELKDWLKKVQINAVNIDEWTIIEVIDKIQEIESRK